MSKIEKLNALEPRLLEERLRSCCGSQLWVAKMAKEIPFANREALFSAASRIWNALTPQDWSEAFSHHPKIGEKTTEAWSSREQAGMREAGGGLVTEMETLNRNYLEKFGYRFIVFASGKSGDEMIQCIRLRLRNDAETEIKIASRECLKITHLRMERLLEEIE